MRFTRKH